MNIFSDNMDILYIYFVLISIFFKYFFVLLDNYVGFNIRKITENDN